MVGLMGLVALGACVADKVAEDTADSSAPWDADWDAWGAPEDCDDDNAAINPDAKEVCAGEVDEDCDGLVDLDDSDDCDTLPPTDPVDSDYDGALDVADCAPDDASIYPGAADDCDGVDADCDGRDGPAGDDLTPEGCVTYWLDEDGDGFGPDGGGVVLCACEADFEVDGLGLEGWTEDASDCDDAAVDVFPGGVEVCGDGADNDCDGDEDDEGAEGCEVYYPDADGDGHYDPDAETCVCAWDEAWGAGIREEEYRTEDLDCDDGEGGVSCTWYYADADGDEAGDPGDAACLCEPDDHFLTTDDADCDDGARSRNPLARESCYTDEDDDCNGSENDPNAIGCYQFYFDQDEDSYADEDLDPTCLCEATGYYTVTSLTMATDCQDDDPTINPGASEACNDIDDDCDGERDNEATETFYLDADGDGFGLPTAKIEACSVPDGYVPNSGEWDCDDGEPTTNPSAVEICDDVDQDCDGEIDNGVMTDWHPDRDGDGFGDCTPAETTESCTDPSDATGLTYTTDDSDCDDADDSITTCTGGATCP